MKNLLNLKNYKSVLCLNGNLDAIKKFDISNFPLIAADGAARKLLNFGIVADKIVGDLDSVPIELFDFEKFVYILDQSKTDFEKSLNFLAENNLIPTIIFGADCGALDHTFNNLNIFTTTNSTIITNEVICVFLKQGFHKFNSISNKKLSIFAMSSCVITSKGLEWELNNSHLFFPGFSSISNKTLNNELVLNIHEGCALMMMYY